MTDRKIELTRRKILGAAGAVGIAGAGAGMGTSALFSDVELFRNNSITAGTLDMSVTATIVEASEYYTSDGEGPEIIGDMETADGEAVVGLQASDVKPGDWVIICFEIDIGENRGYVRISTEDFVQYENGQTEPEAEVDNTAGGSLGMPLDGEREGELQDELIAEVYGTYDSEASSDPPRSYLEDLEPSLSGSARTTYEQFATGVVIGGPANPLEVGSVGDAIKRYLLLELPADVGNEVQSDAIEFDLIFDALQVRNNDGFTPSSSLVGYWPLNSVDVDSAEDLSGNSNDGTIEGDVSSVSGPVADSASFDGEGDYIEISHKSIFDLSDFTVDLWFKTEGVEDNLGVLINKQNSSGRYRDRNWWLAINDGHSLFGNGNLVFRTSSGGAVDVNLVAEADYRDGKWHRAVAVVDPTNDSAKLWVDGTKEDYQNSVGTPEGQGAPIHIGKEIGNGRYFSGAVDDVRIYNRPLSDSEI